MASLGHNELISYLQKRRAVCPGLGPTTPALSTWTMPMAWSDSSIKRLITASEAITWCQCCMLWKHLKWNTQSIKFLLAGIILGVGLANERRRYIVTSSLIGWAHTENDPWLVIFMFLFLMICSISGSICSSYFFLCRLPGNILLTLQYI